MPTYSFVCTVCGRRFDQVMPYQGSQRRLTCPEGHSQVRRSYSRPAVVFKGSGWYSKDSRSAGSKSSNH